VIYRSFGSTGIKISQLGFGAMRLPLAAENDPSRIDEKKASHMLHYAIDNGINYVDTAYPYHREKSEQFVGKVLHGTHRDSVYLATKMPMWLIKKSEDPQKYFSEQLKRLRTDCIDMYLLHALGKNSWKTVQDHDVLSFLDRIRDQGKIRFAGFSFHDELPLFREIVDAYPWTFCLIHLNYVDDTYQAGVEGLEYAYKKGLAVVIMEPLRGGKLANRVPEEVLRIIRSTGRDQTPAQFSLRWLLDKPQINCVLSGMSTFEQVKENILFASREHVNTLSDGEAELYRKAREFYRTRVKVNCTQCGYCLPCPQKISIPFIFELYNDAYMYNALDNSRWMYRVFVKPENRADQCTSCGECEEKCPQNVRIIETLKDAHERFDDVS
jgi:predicted aldo/keto reductase-like oxidoreductase